MWKSLILLVGLVHGHQDEFRAGWEKAKARADLQDRLRHGLVSSDGYMRERIKLMTPQEEAELMRGVRERLKLHEQRIKDHEAMLQRLKETKERWRARRQVGPPPPPDVK